MFIFHSIWLRILFMLVGILLLTVSRKYLKLWQFLKGLEKKGVEVFFGFPMGMSRKFLTDAKKGDALSWFKETVQKNPQVKIMASHFAEKPIIYIIDPELLKGFLSDLSKVKKSSILAPLHPLMKNGLLLTDGNQWKRHRKTLSAIFRYDFIISQLPNIVNTARHIFSREIEAQKGKHIHILDLFQMITGELVFRIFFGEDLEGVKIDGLPPTSYLTRVLDLGATNFRSPENLLLGMRGVKLGLFKRNRDYLQQSKKFLSFCTEMIHNKRKKLESGYIASVPDVLTLLLQSELQSKGTDETFTDEEILHEFVTFFFAGMDTTGHMITMATYFFSKQSEEVQKAVMKEANELTQTGINITSELLNKAETIHAFLKETLRLATPAATLMTREIKPVTGLQIDGLSIPKGTLVNVPFPANNYNPKYHPDPYRFNMNRWISGHPDFEEEAQKNPFSFTPFSAGPRNCIGQHLAMIEGKIIWSIFLSTYNFTIPSGYEMYYKIGILYGPREVLYLDIEKKQES